MDRGEGNGIDSAGLKKNKKKNVSSSSAQLPCSYWLKFLDLKKRMVSVGGGGGVAGGVKQRSAP